MKKAATHLSLSLLLCLAPGRVLAQTNNSSGHFLTLRQAIESALLNNRALQIERINPEIARMTLKASYGYYDPIFTTQARKQNESESGAFDPLNPAIDTPSTSESDEINGGFQGFLPSGLAYDIKGRYVHSTGTQDQNFDSYKLDAEILLAQPLLKNLWIDQPRLLIRVSKRELQISEAGVNFVAMDIVNQVQQAYYDLVFAWENLRVQNDLLTTREKFLRGIERQVEVGALTVSEQRVAASQHANVQALLITGSNTLALAANNLKTLMGVTGTNWTQDLYVPVDRLTVSPDSFDLATSWQRGLARRPDLLQLVKGVEVADLNVKFRRNQLLPSLNIVGGYGRQGGDSIRLFPPQQPEASFSAAYDQFRRGDAPSDYIGLVFSLPLTRTAERASHKLSIAEQKRAELLVNQHQEIIMREISDAIHTAQFSYDSVRATRRAAEFAREALAAEEEKLRAGTSSIIFVLQLQADLATSLASEVRARQTYNRAISQLQFAEGTILDQYNMVFHFE